MKQCSPFPSTLLLLFFAGCTGETAEFGPPQRLPRDQRPTVWDAPMKVRLGVPDMKPPVDKTEKRWSGDTPVGWEALPAQPADFRDAVWRVVGEPDTDCYLTAGVGGGVVGNLTRWYRDQFGVAEVPAVEALTVVEIAGRPGRLAELQGTFRSKPEWAALIAFFADGERVTSLKLTGPVAVVGANRDKFLALSRSLRSASVSPDAKAPPIQPGQPMPPDHPPTGATLPPAPHGVPPSTGDEAPVVAPFTATTPATWLPKKGTSRFLHHTFGSDGEVYVSQLGGSLKATLDIWRGEMSLAPMSDAEFAALPKATFLGDDGTLLDLTGSFQSMSGKQIANARLLVAARLDGGTITFCKLVGPAADVAPQAEAFQQFCATARRLP